MSVIRNRHNAKKPFVILDKGTLWNESLSLKALGLWARCISRPDDWKFFIKEVIKNCKEGRDSIYSGIKELIDARLCIRVQHRIPNGRNGNTPGPVEYIFLEVPASKEEALEIEEEMKSEFKKSLSLPDFPETGFEALIAAETEDPGTEDPGNRTLPSNYIYKEERNKTKTPIIPKGDEREACGAVVRLSKEEFQKAETMCGKEVLKEIIDEMNDYCLAHGKKYKDYLAAIRTWWKKREKQPAKKEDMASSNATWAKKFEEKMKHVARCYCTKESLVFEGFGSWQGLYIRFNEHGFKERVLNQTRKMGLIEIFEGK